MSKDHADEVLIAPTAASSRIAKLLRGNTTAGKLIDDDGKVLLAKGKKIDEEMLADVPQKYWGEIRVTGGDDITVTIEKIVADLEESTAEVDKHFDDKIDRLKKGDELPPGVNQLVRVHVAQKRKISVGDKLAGRHGNKGVISKVLPIEDMPFMADGTPVDIILNPLGVPSRMNVGQVLEAHFGYGARWGWDIDGESVGDQPIRGTETKTRPSTLPAIHVATPALDGTHWEEADRAGRHPTI